MRAWVSSCANIQMHVHMYAGFRRRCLAHMGMGMPAGMHGGKQYALQLFHATSGTGAEEMDVDEGEGPETEVGLCPPSFFFEHYTSGLPYSLQAPYQTCLCAHANCSFRPEETLTSPEMESTDDDHHITLDGGYG